MELFGSHLGAAQITVLLICAFLGGFAKTGIVGMGIVITPLLASVFPAGTALGLMLPLFLAGDILSIVRFNRKVPWRAVLAALPWGAAGTIIGWAVALCIDSRFGSDADRVLRIAIGILMGLVVAISAYLARHPERITRRIPADQPDAPPPGVSTLYTASLGLFSGFANMLTNSGGPVWAVYFSSLDLEVREVIAAGVWAIFVCSLIKMPLSAHLGFFNVGYLGINLLLMPVLVLGLLTGRKIAGRYSRETFARIIRCLAACGAGYMVLS